jgi:DNA integrity scanning protein DisA with diadenylate cyclase activity
VGEHEYRWSERGRLAAAKYGVESSEVIDALEAPMGLRTERWRGSLIVIEGMATSGRIIMVGAERISANLNVYRILLAKPLSLEASDRWRKEFL